MFSLPQVRRLLSRMGFHKSIRKRQPVRRTQTQPSIELLERRENPSGPPSYLLALQKLAAPIAASNGWSAPTIESYQTPTGVTSYYLREQTNVAVSVTGSPNADVVLVLQGSSSLVNCYQAVTTGAGEVGLKGLTHELPLGVPNGGDVALSLGDTENAGTTNANFAGQLAAAAPTHNGKPTVTFVTPLQITAAFQTIGGIVDPAITAIAADPNVIWFGTGASKPADLMTTTWPLDNSGTFAAVVVTYNSPGVVTESLLALDSTGVFHPIFGLSGGSIPVGLATGAVDHVNAQFLFQPLLLAQTTGTELATGTGLSVIQPTSFASIPLNLLPAVQQVANQDGYLPSINSYTVTGGAIRYYLQLVTSTPLGNGNLAMIVMPGAKTDNVYPAINTSNGNVGIDGLTGELPAFVASGPDQGLQYAPVSYAVTTTNGIAQQLQADIAAPQFVTPLQITAAFQAIGTIVDPAITAIAADPTIIWFGTSGPAKPADLMPTTWPLDNSGTVAAIVVSFNKPGVVSESLVALDSTGVFHPIFGLSGSIPSGLATGATDKVDAQFLFQPLLISQTTGTELATDTGLSVVQPTSLGTIPLNLLPSVQQVATQNGYLPSVNSCITGSTTRYYLQLATGTPLLSAGSGATLVIDLSVSSSSTSAYPIVEFADGSTAGFNGTTTSQFPAAFVTKATVALSYSDATGAVSTTNSLATQLTSTIAATGNTKYIVTSPIQINPSFKLLATTVSDAAASIVAADSTGTLTGESLVWYPVGASGKMMPAIEFTTANLPLGDPNNSTTVFDVTFGSANVVYAYALGLNPSDGNREPISGYSGGISTGLAADAAIQVLPADFYKMDAFRELVVNDLIAATGLKVLQQQTIEVHAVLTNVVMPAATQIANQEVSNGLTFTVQPGIFSAGRAGSFAYIPAGIQLVDSKGNLQDIGIAVFPDTSNDGSGTDFQIYLVAVRLVTNKAGVTNAVFSYPSTLPTLSTWKLSTSTFTSTDLATAETAGGATVGALGTATGANVNQNFPSTNPAYAELTGPLLAGENNLFNSGSTDSPPGVGGPQIITYAQDVPYLYVPDSFEDPLSSTLTTSNYLAKLFTPDANGSIDVYLGIYSVNVQTGQVVLDKNGHPLLSSIAGEPPLPIPGAPTVAVDPTFLTSVQFDTTYVHLPQLALVTGYNNFTQKY